MEAYFWCVSVVTGSGDTLTSDKDDGESLFAQLAIGLEARGST